MRAAPFIMAAAVTAALSGTATAQTNAASSASATSQSSVAGDFAGATRSHWVAAGSIGTTLSTSSDNPLVNTTDHGVGFGGQIGYLWRGVVGGEFLADFAPNDRNVLAILGDTNGRVNSFMGNVIGAYPLGAKGQYQPYASGGFGRVSVSSSLFDAISNRNNQIDRVWGGEGRSGTNFGGGLMAFANHLGVRTDIRRFNGRTDNNLPSDLDPEIVRKAQALLSGLAFWRFNAGLAFRW